MIGVEQWAEIRRMHGVERLSIREIGWRTGLHRKTIRRILGSDAPPRYGRPAAGSKLDPFRDWICEQLRVDHGSRRSGCASWRRSWVRGRQDDLRRLRARGQATLLVRRTFQRTVHRPEELVQCDLWEPREPIPVGYGQTRRGWVVTAELCWLSRPGQRLIEGSCDGQAERLGVEADGAGSDAFAGAASGWSAGGSCAVLGCDCWRYAERGGGCRGGCLAGGWQPLVSSSWWDAVDQLAVTVGPLPIFGRAGGDRDSACSGSWGARDRSAVGAVAVDDLA